MDRNFWRSTAERVLRVMASAVIGGLVSTGITDTSGRLITFHVDWRGALVGVGIQGLFELCVCIAAATVPIGTRGTASMLSQHGKHEG